MPLISLKVPEKLYALPTYEEFKDKVMEKCGDYPRGTEMLEYMHRHPDQAKIYFPNPCRIDRPKDDAPKRKGARA